MSKRRVFSIVICIGLVVSCTGCGRYSFLKQIPFIGTLFEKKPETVDEQIDVNQYDLAAHLYGVERPEEFTEQVLLNIQNLEPVEASILVPKEDEYLRKNLEDIEYPENPWEFCVEDPDWFEEVGSSMVERYFASYYYEYTKSMDERDSIPEENYYSYVEVQWKEVLAGNREEFAIAAAVKIYDVNPENTIYTQFGELGDDGCVHCNLTIHAKQTTDYTFTMKGIAHTKDVCDVLEEKFTPVYAEALPVNARNNYKIEDNTLKVTYDNGETWKSVPVSMNDIFWMKSEEEYYTLPSGSYYVSEEKTFVVYGGYDKLPVTMLISYDAGETWKEIVISDWAGIRRLYTGVSDDGSIMYVLACGDKTMGSEWSIPYISYDNGATWTDCGLVDENGTFLVNGVHFFDAQNGIIAVTDHEAPNFLKTVDGGKTWQNIRLETPETGWTMVYAPQIQDNDWVFYVGQDGYGELEGPLYKYVSKDRGVSWQVEGKVIL